MPNKAKIFKDVEADAHLPWNVLVDGWHFHCNTFETALSNFRVHLKMRKMFPNSPFIIGNLKAAQAQESAAKERKCP